MTALSLDVLAMLAAAAFCAGFIDSIAGGGGLIAVPSLLLAGLPPVEALGTNKLQGLFGAGSATLAYARRGQVEPMRQLVPAGLALAGSAAGAVLATVVPGDVLRAILPLLLVAIALYFALKPSTDDLDRARRLSPASFNVTAAPIIGFYDGMFGPGAGSFYMLAFVTLAGFGLLKATAHTKMLNFASNIGAFATFALAGAVWWKLGVLMGAAQFLGARVGAGFAVRGGARLIKPLLVVTCVVLAARLTLDPAYPLRGWLSF
jgi:uncharacterized protein